MPSKTFDVNYYKNPRSEGRELSHKSRERWGLTEYHCLHCGKKEVWHDTSGGDFYIGEEHICTNCNRSFHLPSEPREVSNDEQGKQRLAALKS